MASGSGWNLWVWLAGGGCGWNLLFFAAASLLFVHFFNVFSLHFVI